MSVLYFWKLIHVFTFPKDWIPLDKAIKTVAQDANNDKTKWYSNLPKLAILPDKLRTFLLLNKIFKKRKFKKVLYIYSKIY